MRSGRMLSGFLTVGIWTLLSRVLGFARDILIAAYLGAGPVAEAFVIAFSLPNMFRRFFAEGAFNMAFVPMYAKKVESGDAPGRFAEDAFAAMALLLTAFSALAILAMPGLVWLMAAGFAEDERFTLATAYGRIAFPYILFVSLAALVSGVLNAHGRFAAAAAAPALLNLVFILGLGLSAVIGVPASRMLGLGLDQVLGLHVGTMLALSVPIGGIAQLALVWWAAGRAGFGIRLRRPRWTPELKRLAIIAAPAALAGGVVQVNLLIGRQVASFYDGAVVWLYNADRLYQLPLGVVGVAIGVVLLPELARRLAAGDIEGQRNGFNRAAELCLALTVPAAAALVAVPGPIIAVMFERGAFGPEDTAATALALAIYGLGLPAFVLQKVLQPLYYAREDTRSPFRFAVWAMVVNAALAVGLAPVIGFSAAAWGTTLAGWAMVVLLWRGSRPLGAVAEPDARLRARLPRIVAAALAMAVILRAYAWLAADWLAGPAQVPALALLVGLGLVSYFAIGQAIGAVRLGELRGAVRRRG